jgi:hypothetical protein
LSIHQAMCGYRFEKVMFSAFVLVYRFRSSSVSIIRNQCVFAIGE